MIGEARARLPAVAADADGDKATDGEQQRHEAGDEQVRARLGSAQERPRLTGPAGDVLRLRLGVDRAWLAAGVRAVPAALNVGPTRARRRRRGAGGTSVGHAWGHRGVHPTRRRTGRR